MGRLRLQQRVLSLAFLFLHVNSMSVLLYFWLDDYGKVDIWHNKEIGSLPERVSAPDRFVFFLCSTTMRSPFKIRKPFRRHFMNAPDGLLRMQFRYFKRRQPRGSMVQNSSVIEPCSKKRTTLYYEDTDMQSVLETSRFSMWQFNESEKTYRF